MVTGVFVYAPNGDYREYKVGELIDNNLVISNIVDNVIDGVPMLNIDVVDNNEFVHLSYLKVVGLPFITIKNRKVDTYI